MTQTTTKRSVLDDAKDLKALREELRLQAHLFKSEAKDTFDNLEKRWREVHRIIRSLEDKSSDAAKEISGAVRTTVDELTEQYRGLKDQLAHKK